MKEIKPTTLSLKSIYRLLTMRRWPLAPVTVFPAGQLRSITIVSFWQKALRAAFPEGDLAIFDVAESRSRSLSKLLGGTDGAGFRVKWFRELSAQLSPACYTELVSFYYGFLKDNFAQIEPLASRLAAYCRACSEAMASDSDLCIFIAELPHRCTVVSDGLIRCACILSFLTLHGLFAGHLNDPGLAELRRLHAQCLEEVKLHFMLTATETTLPVVITSGDSVLISHPTDRQPFIGREDMLHTAAQAVLSGHHLAVCGIGGVGKTEFVRQLLSRLYASGRIKRVALMQVEHSLTEALYRAIPGLGSMAPGQLQEHYRTQLAQEGTLLVIDDLNAVTEEDAAFLASVRCPVVVTTRMQSVPRFDILPMGPLTRPESVRLFAAIWQGEVRSEIGEINRLADLVDGHPMMLITLAKTCRIRYWPVSEMNRRLLEQGGSAATFMENGRDVQLQTLLRRTFDPVELEMAEQTLLHIISLLPQARYIPQKLLPLCSDVTGSESALSGMLQRLSDLGWLTRTALGYTMHPAVREALRVTPPDAEELPGLWTYLRGVFAQGLAPENRPLTPLTIHILRHTGKLNRDALDVLVALENLVISAPYSSENDFLLQRHRAYLDTCDHLPADEVRYHISKGYNAIIFRRRERLEEAIHSLAETEAEALLTPASYTSLINMTENAVGLLPPSAPDVQRLMERMVPPEGYPQHMQVVYLMSIAEYRRRHLRDAESARGCLEKALVIVQCIPDGEREGAVWLNVLQALYTRVAYTHADLSHYDQAGSWLDRAIRDARRLSYTDDSPAVMPLRSTAAYFKTLAGQYEEAMDELASILRIRRRSGNTQVWDYANDLQHLVFCALLAGRSREVFEEVPEMLSAMRSQTGRHADIVQTLIYAAAVCLSRGDPDTPIQLLEEARGHMEKAPALPAFKQAEVQIMEAVRQFVLGRASRAAALLDQHLNAYLERWQGTAQGRRAQEFSDKVHTVARGRKI